MVFKFKTIFSYLGLTTFLIFLISGNLLSAENPFKVAITVNNLVITNFELIQRELYNRITNTPGNSRNKAMESLIEERIKQLGIIKYNINVSDKELEDEFVSFASRLGTSKQKLLQLLKSNGIAKETVEDFLKVRLGWSKLIVKRFSKLAGVSDHETKNVELYSNLKSQVFYLLSEIALPVDEANKKAVINFFNELKKEKRSVQQFAQLAKKYSRSESAPRGGALDWRSLSALPLDIHSAIITLQVGELSEPIWLNNSLIVFQMRDKRLNPKGPKSEISGNKSNYNAIKNKLVQERFSSYSEGFLLKLKLEAQISIK